MATLNALLDKAGSWDKDERYMATNDLIVELSKDIKIDELMEKRIVAAVLKQLDDQSNDVQSVAIKCLSIVLKKVKQGQIGEICDKLSSLIMEGKDQYRDIYSIGLKTLISDVHDDMGGLVCQKLIAKFLNGIEKSTNESIRREAIDLVAALLTRFGNLLDINEITAVLLRQLAEAGRRPVLKRVSSCFGALAVAASETQLAHVVQALLDKVQETSSSKRQDGHILGSVQTLGIVTRSVGYRLGKLADKLVPIFLNFCGDPNDLEQESEEMNEIRDYCFLGLESIALRCPRDLEPLLTTVVETTLQFLKYDPNYSYGEVDDADDKDSGDDYDADGNGDEDEEFQGSDDDDTSWKVRKNAVKVMRAIVTTQPVLSDSVANAFASSLLLRFKEREENVRIDVIHCYHELMSKLSTASASEGDVTSVHLASFFSHSFKLLSITGESAAKTKSALFSAIKLLATIRKGDLKPFVSTLIDKIYVALVDKNQVLRLDALLCLRALHESLNPVILTPFAHTSLPLVISCVDADWFRLISEGLRTLNALLKSLESIEKTPATVSMIKKVYTCLIPTLEASDIDIEVKECALQLTGTLFAEYAELLRPELASALQLLKKRLDNDVTRLSTLKTISAIAACSSTLPELIQFLEDTARTLSQLLRQQNRQIQLFALLCLESLVMRSDMKLSEATSETLRAEVSFLFSDSDLQLCSLSLQLFKNLLRLLPLSQQPLYSDIYKRIINLTISPLVGPTQQTLVMLFKDLVSSPENGLESESLLHDLYVAGDTELPSTTAKQSIQNLAKCIAAVCMHSSPQKKDASIKKFVQDIQLEQPAGQTGHARLIALFALGEIGLHMDLFGVEHLNELLLQGLESSSDENKNTTALCLGRIAVGNLASYLNLILESISSGKNQHLLLVSLKEVIFSCSNQVGALDPFLPLMLPFLLATVDSADESVRKIVAECLGVLVVSHSNEVAPLLVSLWQDSLRDAKFRSLWTAITSYRCCMSSHQSRSDIVDILAIAPLIQSCDDLEVKRAVLLLIQAILHHNFDHIYPSLAVVESHLLGVLDLKLERVVDLGPFKHKVDDALIIRKTSLTCMEEILTSPASSGSLMPFVESFIQKLPILLSDKDDIKLDVYQIIVKISQDFPLLLSNHIDMIMESFEKNLSKKGAKEGLNGTDLERAQEVSRGCLRAILAVNGTCDLKFNKKWETFFSRFSDERTDK